MMNGVNWFPMPPYGWPAAAQAHSSKWRGGGCGHGQHTKQKHRFCATFPNVGRCRHGGSCAFAHSRDEITAPLLSAEEDARRPPQIGYGHQLCPFWNKKDTSLAYAQRCPLGPRCPHAHGAKEQLYHPHYFRTLVCRDLQRGRCPRGDLCAFFHKQADCRKVGPDLVDYAVPLPKDNLPADWLASFLNPPRFQEAAGEDGMMDMAMAPPLFPGMGMAPPGAKWMGGFEEDEETTADGLGAQEDSEDSVELQRPGRRGRAAMEALQGYEGYDEMGWGPMPGYEAAYDGMFHGGYPGNYMDASAAYGAGYRW
mmetsp:Transcript_168102/g.539871  ORF Transcript_168102/g.539871 Transcript_168102/m.539871 type:complete len:310 (-) Transcript_168102:189-1118(-)